VPHDIDPTLSPDAFWIFALWRALHGGDPTLHEIAAAAIASLAQYLPVRNDSFGVAPLPPSCHQPVLRECGDSPPDDLEDAEFAELEFDSRELPAVGAAPEPPTYRDLALLCHDLCEFSPNHCYFRFKGVFYRLDRPVSACLPTAA
jgi:hypothetical protein